MYRSASVASPEVVMRCGAKVLAQLQDSYIVDEVTMEEFEDPQIVEHVAMVTIGNVEYNKATKDHVREYQVFDLLIRWKHFSC